MTQQTFSLEMSRLLSSLAPEFEGHWWYVNWDEMLIICCLSAIHEYGQIENKICPAWQVEDVLRNWLEIQRKFPWSQERQDALVAPGGGARFIASCLVLDGDTAYQKIEEYLWEILGHSRTEECTGAHCKCMQNDCANHHYNDHKK